MIGILDSGIGGVSVLKEIVKLIPNGYFIYYSDSINNPYGDKSDDEVYAIVKENKTFITNKTIVTVYIIYLLGIFIPDILGIGFDSYAISKEGSIGFFNTANEISAIISILMPFFLLYLYEKKNFFLTVLLIGILVFDILSIGTKGPLLSFVLILGVILFIYIIYLAKERLYKVLSILVVTLILFVLFTIIIFRPFLTTTLCD